MGASSFNEIKEIVYKNISQTDILMEDMTLDKIALRNPSLSKIAPVLRSSSVSPKQGGRIASLSPREGDFVQIKSSSQVASSAVSSSVKNDQRGYGGMDKMRVETAAETLLGKVKKDRIWSQMGDMDMD